MSIVPIEKLKNDPQTLLYHFPSIHPIRYQKLIHDFTFWKQVETAEKVAKMGGMVLVPRDCIHWERKKGFDDRRIIIQKHVFFVLSESEMTRTEINKYRLALVV